MLVVEFEGMMIAQPMMEPFPGLMVPVPRMPLAMIDKALCDMDATLVEDFNALATKAFQLWLKKNAPELTITSYRIERPDADGKFQL